MKIAILILLCLNLAAQTGNRIKLSDETKHAWTCTALNFGANVTGFEFGLTPLVSLTGSALIVFGIGAGKELMDDHFSWKDMGSNTQGIAMGTFGAVIYIGEKNKKQIDKTLYE